ncbi:hypothetical protein D9757_001141 [Collybiopsis confluens]|uniref:Uncharacterized protein n=1 Tax=Collybiopsis confluens TaxID=2823264 RepID=A0A8H5I0N5_9AGAR|nr:hypothetical protein D9757_001141 [Collybiopsis confluens]
MSATWLLVRVITEAQMERLGVEAERDNVIRSTITFNSVSSIMSKFDEFVKIFPLVRNANEILLNGNLVAPAREGDYGSLNIRRLVLAERWVKLDPSNPAKLFTAPSTMSWPYPAGRNPEDDETYTPYIIINADNEGIPIF